MTDLPTNKLSIYLIKEFNHNYEDILRNFDKLEKEEIKFKNEIIGTLFYSDSYISEPSWIKKFFSASFKNKIPIPNDDESNKLKLYNAISRAVLLIESVNRIFAICFGYGWTLLNHGAWEERFGLKVALNTIDIGSIRHIGKKNMALVPKDIKEQLSRAGLPSDFGIDIEQDMIQSITGKSKDEAFGTTVTGKDSFSVSVKVDLSNVKEFLNKCFEKYSSNDYKKDFGWIDQIEETKDIDLIDRLNNQLIENIKAGEAEKTWMAVPEIIDWADVLGFSYKDNVSNISATDDICLSNFVDSLSEENRNNLSIDILRRKKVFCFSAQSEQVIHQWSAFNCLYCEIRNDSDGKTYILTNGKWYEVENDFSSQIDTDYKNLRDQEKSIYLPPYAYENENDYNEKVAENNNEFYCMDRKNITYGGGYSRIEFCDLLTNNKKIIHVKRYGGSSVLSHLFSQGIVSGELFIADKNFRELVNEKLPESHKFDDIENRPIASDYEVIFAVISSVGSDLDIPFFSKVNLRSARRRLEAFGYKVSLQKIESENQNND